MVNEWQKIKHLLLAAKYVENASKRNFPENENISI